MDTGHLLFILAGFGLLITPGVTAKDSSIKCYSKGTPDSMELVVIGGGETPKAGYLELDDAMLLNFHNTKIFCCTHDIELIKRSCLPEEKVYYKEVSGNVIYECDDDKLGGVKLPTENFRENVEYCVKIGNKPQGMKDRDNLGYPCVCSSGACRMMFNESQKIVCSLCCANHYFSIQSNNCEECGGCFINPDPSVRTSCMYDHNCKRPITPNELSTINKKSHTSKIILTSTTSTPTSTSTTSKTPATSTTGTTSTTNTTSTTVTTTTSSKTAKNDESGLKAGLAIAGVLVLVLIVGFLYFYCKRSSSSSKSQFTLVRQAQ